MSEDKNKEKDKTVTIFVNAVAHEWPKGMMSYEAARYPRRA